MKKLDRREFLSAVAGIGATLAIGGCAKNEAAEATSAAPRAARFDEKTLAVASGKDPAKLTRAAVDALGGMSKLVKKGDYVVIKPNIAWNQPAEVGATTNPKVVAEIVKMCKESGASKILVIDHVIDKPAEMVLGLSGIQAECEKAGAKVASAQNESDYRTIEIPKGKAMKTDTCIKELLKADVWINVPIAKVHGMTKLTLGLKNLMGCNWDRQNWHQNSLEQCIADYATAIRPDLTILDANRIMLSGGPKGPGKTKDVGQVIAGVDPVAIDAYGSTLFGMKPTDIKHIQLAHELGVGEIDLTKVKIKQV
jgi:uncharacterized protein (DUF362 family)